MKLNIFKPGLETKKKTSNKICVCFTWPIKHDSYTYMSVFLLVLQFGIEEKNYKILDILDNLAFYVDINM